MSDEAKPFEPLEVKRWLQAMAESVAAAECPRYWHARLNGGPFTGLIVTIRETVRIIAVQRSDLTAWYTLAEWCPLDAPREFQYRVYPPEWNLDAVLRNIDAETLVTDFYERRFLAGR